MLKEGERLWKDTKLSTNGLSCNTCHQNNAAFNATFAKPYPHPVQMPKDRAGLKQVNIDEMVQLCMLIPMAAKALPWDSKELAALSAYSLQVQKTFKPAAAKSATNPCATKNPCAAKNPCAPGSSRAGTVAGTVPSRYCGAVPAVALATTLLSAASVLGQTGWVAPASEKQKRSPVAADPKAIEVGRSVARANCVPCHGESFRGNGPAATALNPKPADWT